MYAVNAGYISPKPTPNTSAASANDHRPVREREERQPDRAAQQAPQQDAAMADPIERSADDQRPREHRHGHR